MTLRNRILDFRRVPAGSLQPHPHNWRIHPPAQRAALREVLEQIGYADALLARKTAEGTLELIDGHLRAELTPEEIVPVLVVDLDEQEAAALLAVHDPLAAMAGSDDQQLAQLLAATDRENEALQKALDEIASQGQSRPTNEREPLPEEIELPHLFQVVVECEDEQQQRDVYEQMTKVGYACRVLTL